MGAIFAPTRFSLLRISIRDLVADGKSLLRSSGVGGGGEDLILSFDLRFEMSGGLAPAPRKRSQKGSVVVLSSAQQKGHSGVFRKTSAMHMIEAGQLVVLSRSSCPDHLQTPPTRPDLDPICKVRKP